MSTIVTSNVSDGTLSIPTTYVTNGSAKAWGQADQTVPTLRDSLNVSSLIDVAAGSFDLVFASAMATANYSQTSTALKAGVYYMFASMETPTTSECGTVTFPNSATTTAVDANYACTTIHGDLA
jgi:hypothetical protein